MGKDSSRVVSARLKVEDHEKLLMELAGSGLTFGEWLTYKLNGKSDVTDIYQKTAWEQGVKDAVRWIARDFQQAADIARRRPNAQIGMAEFLAQCARRLLEPNYFQAILESANRQADQTSASEQPGLAIRS